MKKKIPLIYFYFFIQFFTVGQLLTIDPDPHDFDLHDDSLYYSKIMKYGIDNLLDLSVYSAGKKTLKVSEVPASIVIITHQDIIKHGYQSLEDLIANIPGFYSLGDAFYFGGTNFGVRGFASSGAFNNVMIMINGVNQMEDFSNSFSTDKINIPIQAIDRVEVIRGPMAIVYGSNAFMGSINIITNDIRSSSDTTHVIASSSYGSLNTKRLFTQVKGQENNITYNFNGGIEQTDGRIFKYNDLISNPQSLIMTNLLDGKTTRNQLSEESKYLTFNSSFKNLSLHLDLSETRKGTLGLVPSIDFEKGWIMNIVGANVQTKYKLKLHQKINASIKYTYSSYEYNSNDLEVIHPNMYGILKINSKAQEWETNMIYDMNPKMNIILGAFLRNVGTIDWFVDAPIIGAHNQNSFLNNSSINTFSSFTEISYKPFKKLQLTAGLRFEKTNNYYITKQVTVIDSLFNPLIPVTQENKIYNDNIDEPQFIPRFAAIYSLNKKNILKFIYAQSKKRASFVENDNAFIGGNNQLTFASMNTIEINYLTILSHYFSINTSIYHNTLHNLINRSIAIYDDNSVTVVVDNSGEMKTRGVELSIQTEPAKRLHIESSINYQSTIDYSYQFEEKTASLAPQLLGYLKASFDITNTTFIGLKGRYVSSIESEFNPATQMKYSPTTPSYFILDINLHTNIWRGFFVDLLISNLTNTEVRYVSSQNTMWMDKGMLGYQRRFNFTLGYRM